MSSLSTPPVEVLTPTSALREMESAAIDMQVATAKRYPRDISTFLDRAKSAIGENADLAAQCGYEIPRAGKLIVGPSVRLAEMAVAAWGNFRIAIVADAPPHGAKSVTVHAMGWDLEANVAATIPKTRKIHAGKAGWEDAAALTQNAAASIAYRDAVLRLIPRAYIDDLYDYAMEVAAGDVQDMDTARSKVVAAFEALGVDVKAVCRVVGVEGPKGLDIPRIAALRGIYARIKRGEMDPKDVFKPSEEEEIAEDKSKERAAEDLFDE